MRAASIAGHGHNGFTNLSIALGQHPAMMGAGELFRLTEGRRNSQFCSSGAALPHYPIWTSIVECWQAIRGGDPIAGFRRLQATARIVALMNKRSSAAHCDLSRAPFLAIHEVGGCRVIVDASKQPYGAALLARTPDLDISPVHLVRDGRGTASSLSRRLGWGTKAGPQMAKQPRSVLPTRLLWMVDNIAVESIARTLPPEAAAGLSDETVMHDPRAAFARLANLCGLDMTAVANDVMLQDPLGIDYVMAGDRVRMTSHVPLRSYFEWQTRLPFGQQRLPSRLCYPALRRCGCPLAPLQ